MVPLWNITGRMGNQMFQFAYIWAQMRRGLIPDQYVQSHEYFEEFSDEIRQLYGSNVVPVDAVSIHVRRGDYVNNPFYVSLGDTDYYEQAVKLFPNEKFLVFCQDRQGEQRDVSDREWCVEYFTKLGIDFMMVPYENNEIQDLNLMAGCKHNIIANSSFSWWAGFINSNPDKIVVYPKKWYSDGISRTKCPSNWVGI